MDNEKYLPELMAEKDSLDPSFRHSLRLLDQGKFPARVSRNRTHGTQTRFEMKSRAVVSVISVIFRLPSTEWNGLFGRETEGKMRKERQKERRVQTTRPSGNV
ncbi:hypothetical protein SRHO_G00098100 [Serrasalmus rhombeus]